MDQDYILPISTGTKVKTLSVAASSCSDAFTYSRDKALTFVHVNSGSSDSPSLTGEWDILQTGSGDYGWQIGCQTNTNDLYFRRLYAGVWNAWEELALNSKLGDPSSASAVTGNDAFSKINTLNNSITKHNVFGNWNDVTQYMASGFVPDNDGFIRVIINPESTALAMYRISSSDNNENFSTNGCLTVWSEGGYVSSQEMTVAKGCTYTRVVNINNSAKVLYRAKNQQ